MEQAPSASTQPLHTDGSFHAKSAGVSLVVVMTIGIYYFVRLLQLDAAGPALPTGFLGLVTTTIILLIVVEAVLQIVLAIGAGQLSAANERDRGIGLRATRNAYAVLIVGVFMTFGAMFLNPSPFVMGNILLLAFVLAEITKFTSQLIGYRSPA